MKKYAVKKFTLIELLAAMAVFSILLMLSIRLFTGAQNLWLRSEQKTNTFASARIAMEILASSFQTLNYHHHEPFEMTLESADDKADSIWFISNRRLPGRDKYSQRFEKYILVDPNPSSGCVPKDSCDVKDGKFCKKHKCSGTLQMLLFKDHKTNSFYDQLFPSYLNDQKKRGDGQIIVCRTDATTHVNNVFTELEKDSLGNHESVSVDGAIIDAATVDIIENVIGFKLKGHYLTGTSSGMKASSNGTHNYAPYLLEIELKVLDSKDNFRKWQLAPDGHKADYTGKDDIFEEYGYTFRRAVLLGKKGVE